MGALSWVSYALMRVQEVAMRGQAYTDSLPNGCRG